MSLPKRSKTLDAYVIQVFLVTFMAALAFFVLIIQMAELFAHIVQYMENEVGFKSILQLLYYNTAKSASWALPVAMLFSVSFSFGSMFNNRELFVVYGSGLSLSSFSLPVILIAAFVSLGYFYFEDRVVIPFSAKKNELSSVLLKYGEARGFSDITIIGKDGKYIWTVEYFDKASLSLSGISVIQRDDSGKFVSRLNAQSAEWTGSHWHFGSVRRFFFQGGILRDETSANWDDPLYDESPDSFLAGSKAVNEMQLKEALSYVKALERSGIPFASQKSEVYKRFAFSVTPLLVCLLSLSLVGRFKSNILLTSMLSSLVFATIFYVIQMISMLLSKNEIIRPIAGAFSPVVIFLLLTVLLLKTRHD